MSLSAFDLQSFINQLAEQPQARAQLRALLLADALQLLPERFDRLTSVVTQLAEAQQRSEERLTRLEATVQTLAEAQQRSEERLTRLEDTIQTLAEAQQRTEARLEELAEAQRQMATGLAELIAAQQRNEQRFVSLEEAIRALTGEVSRLVTWQRGEAGRRDGERFERQIVKRAPALFNGGQGGATDKPEVQTRLTALMSQQWAQGEVADEDDPFLADLIWWKGTQLAVIEASQQVDSNDIQRAAQRAATLQRAGAQVIGIVIGEEWMADDTRKLAEARSVQWKVGNDLSHGFLNFRRVAA